MAGFAGEREGAEGAAGLELGAGGVETEEAGGSRVRACLHPSRQKSDRMVQRQALAEHDVIQGHLLERMRCNETSDDVRDIGKDAGGFRRK